MENIVKSWEAEIHNKLVAEQIESIDQEHFSMATNNKTPYKVDDVLRMGTYCCLLEGVKHPAVDMNIDESNAYFNDKFKTGFAWEVLKVFSGPPKVVFSFRHWGHLNTSSLAEEKKGKGKLIELFGTVRAIMSAEGRLQDIEIYFDQEEFMEKITAAEGKSESKAVEVN